jgi:hypothetical protein
MRDLDPSPPPRDGHQSGGLEARQQAARNTIRGVLREVITELGHAADLQSPADLIGAILTPSTRITHINKRPPPSPHLRI